MCGAGAGLSRDAAGVEGGDVSRWQPDRCVCQDLAAKELDPARASVLAYCWMINHYWIVVPEMADSLAVLFRRVHTRYTAVFQCAAAPRTFVAESVSQRRGRLPSMDGLMAEESRNRKRGRSRLREFRFRETCMGQAVPIPAR